MNITETKSQKNPNLLIIRADDQIIGRLLYRPRRTNPGYVVFYGDQVKRHSAPFSLGTARRRVIERARQN